MKKDVIIACDFSTRPETILFLNKFRGEKPFVKIGMELFYSEGPDIVREIKRKGHKIFLDLKLHDIPNTVRKAMKSLSVLDVDMINIHAAGSKEMIKAAREGLMRADGTHPLLIAVTQLTSISEQMLHDELLIERSMEETVMHYAKNAYDSGADGIVCSPLEAMKVKEHTNPSFITVTPGIRFEGAVKDDQARVTTPEKAKSMGCDYIVVGRPITLAEDPVAAYHRCLKEFIG